jgi:D-amino-acid dehydrogenase
MIPRPAHDVAVIGGGIIGLNCALALQTQGRRVCILDRSKAPNRASDMNAGAFAFSDIEPLATPGIMRKAPKWLLDPLGPLSVPPAYALQIAPWMLRFWRATRANRYEAAVAAQSALMQLSRTALEQQIVETGGQPLLRREGQLQLYEGTRAFRASLAGWELRHKHGVRFHLLESPDEIAEIQPGLDRRFTHAGYTPDWINTCDPSRWLTHLRTVAATRGAVFEQADVQRLVPHDGGIEIEMAGGSLFAERVVVAAGAWSHHLAASLGDRIPLETERGYNTTLPGLAFNLKTHLTFPAHGFVVTRVGDGIRVGGAVELGGLTLPPNYRRADILLEKAKRFLPGLDGRGGTRWMGFRPSLPDSLPVIDRSRRDGRVVYAFGHGHLGLTQSAGTAELVAGLVASAPPPIDLHAFSASRFQGTRS